MYYCFTLVNFIIKTGLKHSIRYNKIQLDTKLFFVTGSMTREEEKRFDTNLWVYSTTATLSEVFFQCIKALLIKNIKKKHISFRLKFKL